MAYQPDDDRFYDALAGAGKDYQKYRDRVAEDQAATTRQLGQMYGQALPNTINAAMKGADWSMKRGADQQKMDLALSEEQRAQAGEGRAVTDAERKATEFDWKTKEQEDKLGQLQKQRAFEEAPATEEEAAMAGLTYAPGMTHSGLQRSAGINEYGQKGRDLKEKGRESDLRATELAENRAARIAQSEESRKTRETTHADVVADRQARTDEARAQKLGDLVDKDSQHLVETMKGSSKDPIGAAKAKINSAEHIENLIKDYPNLDDMPPSIQRELAVSMATMLSPGLPHEATIEAMDTKTLESRISEMAQGLTGKPVGSGRGEFAQMMSDTVTRQKAVSQEQLAREQARLLAGFSRLQKNDPESYNRILKSNQIDPADFDANGNYVPKKVKKDTAGALKKGGKNEAIGDTARKTVDPQVDSYAKTYGMDYEHARKVLLKRGYEPADQ